MPMTALALSVRSSSGLRTNRCGCFGLSQDGPEWHDDNARIDELWNSIPKLVATRLAERGEMRPTFLLARGDFLKPVSEVAPGVPAFCIRCRPTPRRRG